MSLAFWSWLRMGEPRRWVGSRSGSGLPFDPSSDFAAVPWFSGGGHWFGVSCLIAESFESMVGAAAQSVTQD
jgi:hypothetical protein